MIPPAIDEDQLARERALDTTRSIVLQAPAGSGKTTLLTQRFLALLARVDEPEAILAMTFTRKAATEMRSRVLEALALAARPQAPTDAAGQRTYQLACAAAARAEAAGWRLQENPARLRITTIDGLNRSIVSALPLLSEGVGSLEIAAHPERLYREAARRALEDAEADESLQAHSARVFARLDNRWDRLESLLARMLATRAQWLRALVTNDPAALRVWIETTLDRLTREAIDDAARRLGRERCERAVRLASRAAQALERSGKDPLLQSACAQLARGVPPAEDLDAADWWRSLGVFALTRAGSLRKSVNVSSGFPNGSSSERDTKVEMEEWLESLGTLPQIESALAALLRLPPRRFSDVDAAVLDSLVRLLVYATAQLSLHQQHAGEVDYVAIAAAAREALHDPSVAGEGVLHQGARLMHLLIDEFQDTSIDQFELIGALTADWAPGDGRTLFLVGDPMQSIYQFREADVGLFVRARDYGIGRISLESLALGRNFRSQSAVVEFVNEVFAKVFPPRDDSRESAVAYLPCMAATDKAPNATVTITPRVWVIDGGAESDRAREAQEIRRLVESIRRDSPTATIAVLVAARRHAIDIVARLRAGRIAVQGVDLVPLAETPVVQDLLALTRALRSPLDRVAWLAVLRAPWCGATLVELSSLLGDDSRRPIVDCLRDVEARARLSADTRIRFERFVAALQEIESRPHASLAERIEWLWLVVGGPTAYSDPGALRDARRYLDALAAYRPRTAAPSADEFDELLEGLYSQSDAPSVEAVQVMTIHRAKGLEFDCVLLPGLARRSQRDEQPLLDWVEWSEGEGDAALLMAPIRAGDSEEPAALGQWIRALRAVRARHERARVLYVACTRARSALYLLAGLGTDEKGLPKAPARDTPLGILWPAVAERFTAALADPVIPALAPSQTPAPGRSLERLAADWVPPPWPDDVPFESLPVLSGELAAPELDLESVAYIDTDNDTDPAEDDTARRLGIVLHRELERYARLESLPTPADVDGDVQRLQAALRAEGVEPSSLARALETLRTALHRTLEDPRGRWILQRHPRDDQVEWALTGRHEGRWVSVVIDRAFIDERGERWIVDYKATHPEGQDMQAFLLAKRNQYAPQLRRYADFVARIDGRPVRAALYFPLIAQFIELDLSAH